MAVFYVVATPIGNLGDITFRAVEVLKEVDLILCEDTSVTKKLLFHYRIKNKTLKRYNEHSPEKTFRALKGRFLKDNVKVALVADSGTPAVSDPGYKLLDFLHNKMPEVNVRTVPGASAVSAVLAVAGASGSSFTFLGFPPQKNKRKKFFENLAAIKTKPVILYEAPHRIQKTLNSLGEILGADKEIFVAREMTKIYEEYFRGKVGEAKDYFKGSNLKGEFVLVIY